MIHRAWGPFGVLEYWSACLHVRELLLERNSEVAITHLWKCSLCRGLLHSWFCPSRPSVRQEPKPGPVCIPRTRNVYSGRLFVWVLFTGSLDWRAQAYQARAPPPRQVHSPVPYILVYILPMQVFGRHYVFKINPVATCVWENVIWILDGKMLRLSVPRFLSSEK